MTVHLLGLPHTETTRTYEWCAYTAKIRKLATMLTRSGIDVVLYAGEDNEAEVGEFVTVVSREEQAAWFGERDWARDVFNDFDPALPWWRSFNARAAAAIAERIQPHDVIGVTMGISHRPVVELVARPDTLAVETGVGYSGVWAPYRVFESWAWRHYLAAREPTDDVRFFDDTIPNAVELEAFPAGAGDGDYFLYIGRLTARKGPAIAAAACQRIGARLVVAGQGVASAAPGRIVTTDGTVLEGDVEYAGVVGPDARAKLMGHAIATFVPTTYLEPFGGVSVETQMAGTPAIVADWGGLTENVEHGRTGFRCRTLAEFADAALAAPSLDRSAIRGHAAATWSTDAIAPRYTGYLDRLGTLWGEGWYA